jgi:hypothetical protein
LLAEGRKEGRKEGRRIDRYFFFSSAGPPVVVGEYRQAGRQGTQKRHWPVNKYLPPGILLLLRPLLSQIVIQNT